MNEVVFFAEFICFLGAVLLVYRWFGKTGLYIFSVFGMLLANIQVLMLVKIFGVITTGGNPLYASTFFITDLLNEKYGKKAANKAVVLGFVSLLLWLLGTRLTLLYMPHDSDTFFFALKPLFDRAPRILAASLAAYGCSQFLDVWLYNKIWSKTGSDKRYLWLRNNGSTLVSQLVDTVIFTFIAFYNTVDTSIFISIVLTTYLFKGITTIGDTPFIYLARRITPQNERKRNER